MFHIWLTFVKAAVFPMVQHLRKALQIMKKYLSTKLPLLLIAAVQLLQVSSIRASTNCVTPPLGLVSWWRAEGDATDATGLNPGVLINALTFTNGEVGQAFGLSA